CLEHEHVSALPSVDQVSIPDAERGIFLCAASSASARRVFVRILIYTECVLKCSRRCHKTIPASLPDHQYRRPFRTLDQDRDWAGILARGSNGALRSRSSGAACPDDATARTNLTGRGLLKVAPFLFGKQISASLGEAGRALLAARRSSAVARVAQSRLG